VDHFSLRCPLAKLPQRRPFFTGWFYPPTVKNLHGKWIVESSNHLTQHAAFPQRVAFLWINAWIAIHGYLPLPFLVAAQHALNFRYGDIGAQTGEIRIKVFGVSIWQVHRQRPIYVCTTWVPDRIFLRRYLDGIETDRSQGIT
jgi:hypothetical protein